MSNVHPIMQAALAGIAPPNNAAVARIRELEARIAELERKLRFKQEAIAQFAAKYEELCPHDTEAELPDGSSVTAPEQVMHDALIWLREKYILEWCARIDEKTLLHFEVEKAETRIAAWEDRQS